MSTIPKDDFHDLLLDLISLARDYDTSTQSKLIEIEEFYQLATDGREELEREIKLLKQGLTDDLLSELLKTRWKEAKDQITALQSQCTEKEKTIELLASEGRHQSESIYKYHRQIEELKAENERLKRLVPDHPKEML